MKNPGNQQPFREQFTPGSPDLVGIHQENWAPGQIGPSPSANDQWKEDKLIINPREMVLV
jgi:hypothetical protein